MTQLHLRSLCAFLVKMPGLRHLRRQEGFPARATSFFVEVTERTQEPFDRSVAVCRELLQKAREPECCLLSSCSSSSNRQSLSLVWPPVLTKLSYIQSPRGKRSFGRQRYIILTKALPRPQVDGKDDEAKLVVHSQLLEATAQATTQSSRDAVMLF